MEYVLTFDTYPPDTVVSASRAVPVYSVHFNVTALIRQRMARLS